MPPSQLDAGPAAGRSTPSCSRRWRRTRPTATRRPREMRDDLRRAAGRPARCRRPRVLPSRDATAATGLRGRRSRPRRSRCRERPGARRPWSLALVALLACWRRRGGAGLLARDVRQRPPSRSPCPYVDAAWHAAGRRQRRCGLHLGTETPLTSTAQPSGMVVDQRPGGRQPASTGRPGRPRRRQRAGDPARARRRPASRQAEAHAPRCQARQLQVADRPSVDDLAPDRRRGRGSTRRPAPSAAGVSTVTLQVASGSTGVPTCGRPRPRRGEPAAGGPAAPPQVSRPQRPRRPPAPCSARRPRRAPRSCRGDDGRPSSSPRRPRRRRRARRADAADDAGAPTPTGSRRPPRRRPTARAPARPGPAGAAGGRSGEGGAAQRVDLGGERRGHARRRRRRRSRQPGGQHQVPALRSAPTRGGTARPRSAARGGAAP